MLELLRRQWWLVVLRGAVAVLFGILAVAWPGITVLALAVLWGAYVLVDGIAAAVIGLTGGPIPGADRWAHVLLGALGVLTGALALVWPEITVLVLLLLIAAWSIVAGVLQVAAAIRLRKVIDNEWLLALTGVIALALGVLLIVQPAEGALALVVAIGIFAAVWGMALIVLGFRLRSFGRSFG
ncbi:uncharacterized membrane protein HdeD (DUF308 family) [Amycolatopsis cihanbeyliensis]|uniref:Uncharacterized membrane protein HdeD (DUF308 family) n=2 Tax=Amycolatopsis cihanbeyliensis TaxID=1128664 RepID=A0A542CSE8_AMYCI|nr:uncharacterized membrane protein HdeD (DUF308 family) [Amycolatopsis cihanbeyliensis]